MVSFTQGHDTMSFKGLSSDDKPVGEYKGYKIKNGSSFFELDTADIYFYDEENEDWIKMG